MFPVGEGAIGFPVILPGIHVYDAAPDPVNVVDCPAQILVLLAVAVTDGNELTVTERTEVFVQPFTSVPVTVYVVFKVGVAVTLAPDKLPGIHV